MAKIPVSDIRQVPSNMHGDLKFLEVALAVKRLENKALELDDTFNKVYVLKYGQVVGLRNLSPLAAYVAWTRKKHKFTQAQLAQAAGVSVNAVSKIENDTVESSAVFLRGCGKGINANDIQRVLTVLQVDVRAFVEKYKVEWKIGGKR